MHKCKNTSNHSNLNTTHANAQTKNCKYAILNFYRYILHRAIVIYNTIEKLCIQLFVSLTITC